MTTRAVGTILRPTTLQRQRGRRPTVVAGIGLVLALGWTVAFLQLSASHARDQRAQAQRDGRALVELLRSTVQARAAADAQMLAQDPRLQSTLAVAKVDDATILDILQDLQKLNPQALFAVLSPSGRVRVVLGAPVMQGLDLSTSAVVKAAQGQDDAALGTWLVDDRVEEVAMISVRAGERVVALLAVGNRLDEAALTTAARTARVHLALLVDEQPVWTSTPQPAATWSSGSAERIEVKGSVPPAVFVAAALPPDQPLLPLAWAVPTLALVFALLALWRRGGK